MSYYNYVTQVLPANAVSTANATESAIMNTPRIDEQVAPASGVLVSGFINVLAGTGTTAVVVKVRAGVGVGGTQLLSGTHTLAAGASANIPFEFVDYSGAFPIGQYTVTVTQTGGTAPGTVSGVISASPIQEA